MDPKKSKELLRKHKKVRPPSSSSSSSSDSESGSSSDSSSSSSSGSQQQHPRRKVRNVRTRASSSSTNEEKARKRQKHACHKKLEAKKLHIRKKLKEAKLKKRAVLEAAGRRKSLTPGHKKLVPGGIEIKHHALSVREKLREKERERERERGREREREKEKEKLRKVSRERIKSRSPRQRLSPKQVRRPIEPPQRRLSPREKIIIRRERTPERPKEVRRHHHVEPRETDRDRRDRERAEREEARNKERAEALARCQERQRERERLAREKLRREKEDEYVHKPKDRLLPRPAEREMAIAAARAGSRERSLEPDPRRPIHRPERRDVPYERGYEREREFPPHDHRERVIEERREHDREREFLLHHRREASPRHISPYQDRVRNHPEREREIYSDENKRYVRENDREFVERPPYTSPVDDRHRRNDRNWDREHEAPPRGEHLPPEHGKIYPRDRPGPSRDWDQERGWDGTHDSKWGEEKWPRKDPIEENWDDDVNYPPGEWDKHPPPQQRAKHEMPPRGTEHHMPLPGGPHGPQHARKWQSPQQEWRPPGKQQHPGHMNMQQQSPIIPHGNFRHKNPPHQGPGPILPHVRPNLFRRNQGPQQHHPPGFHPRIPFNKRQMSYVNPNQIRPLLATPVQPPTMDVIKSVPATTNAPSLAKIAPPTPQVGAAHGVTPIKKHENILSDSNQIIKPLDSILSKESLRDELNKKNSELNDLDGSSNIGESDEPIPDNLSEFSDDADEILEKVEDKTLQVNEPENSNKASIGEKKENSTEAKIEEVTKPFQDLPVVAQVANDEDDDTMMAVDVKDDDILDFEEISDNELEEESRIKNLGDALGVDWASLVEESKNRGPLNDKQATTAKQKWQPHRVILDVGISLKFAGKEFATKILNDAQEKLKEETDEIKKMQLDEKSKIKTEDMKIKLEPQEEEDLSSQTSESLVKKEEVQQNDSEESVLNPIACLQVEEIKLIANRKALVFTAAGNKSRALSARQDLKMRRQLCGLPLKEVRFNPVSNHLKQLALKAFQKAVG